MATLTSNPRTIQALALRGVVRPSQKPPVQAHSARVRPGFLITLLRALAAAAA